MQPDELWDVLVRLAHSQPGWGLNMPQTQANNPHAVFVFALHQQQLQHYSVLKQPQQQQAAQPLSHPEQQLQLTQQLRFLPDALAIAEVHHRGLGC